MAGKLIAGNSEKAELAERIVYSLCDRYQDVKLGNKEDPLDELIFILLTVRTDYRRYEGIWKTLKIHFPSWEKIIESDINEVAMLILYGGMQNQKASRIMNALIYLQQTTNRLSLDFLRGLLDEDSEKFLLNIPGVGKKIARCVMLFSLHRQVLPVDSNIIRVAKRIGLIASVFDDNKNSDLLQELTPREIRHDFHVYVVSLGRELCTISAPRCIICPLVPMCNYGRKVLK